MAGPFSDPQPITPSPPPTSVAVKQTVPDMFKSGQRNSPQELQRMGKMHSTNTKEQQAPSANKQQLEQTFKRKIEENVNNSVPKKHKLLEVTQRTDTSKQLLQKLEEAPNTENTQLPCEWPRVAEGEFILGNSELGSWYCSQCGKSFDQRSKLQIHICSFSSSKPYQCGHCAQRFSHPNELRTHAVIHSGKKPFKCGFCSRAFAGATTLNNHVRTHTGEKPFTCNNCHKTFSQLSHLSRHKRMRYECFA